jgi:hypothetical protein
MEKRNNSKTLILIKIIHTAIWFIFASAIIYVLYAGIFDRVNMLVWVCVGLVFAEAVILFIFKWKCPFTILGYKYTDNPKTGFDIFLPVWLAKNNKMIFTTIFAVGLVLVLLRVF